MRLANAFQLSCAVHTAARLELGRHLGTTAGAGKTVEELAELTGCRARDLDPLLGFLVHLEVIAEPEPGLFGATAVSERLHLVDNIAQGPEGLAAWSSLYQALRTGATPFETAHGVSFYQLLAERPEQAERWQQWNTYISSSLVSPIAASVPLTGDETVVDVGGGEGNLLAEILDRHPGCRGVLFELPPDGPVHPVLRQAPHRVVRGDAGESLPALGQVYLLCRVLLNCSDDAAVSLLEQCRRAMVPGNRLIVFETLRPEPGDPMRNALAASDLNLFALWGGGHRSRDELQSLFRQAGLPTALALPDTPQSLGGFEMRLPTA